MNRRALKIVLLVEVLAILMLSLYNVSLGIGALIGAWSAYAAIKLLVEPVEQKKKSIDYSNLNGWDD